LGGYRLNWDERVLGQAQGEEGRRLVCSECLGRGTFYRVDEVPRLADMEMVATVLQQLSDVGEDATLLYMSR
jgi:hypothetical protein